MFNRKLYVALLLGVSIVSFAQIPDGPYLGQTPPGSVPEVFAPGLICLPGRMETKIVFSPDGQECFIKAGALFYTKQEDGHWLTPDTVDFLGGGNPGEPFVSPDGGRLFFIRGADIWVSNSSSGQWSEPFRLSYPISTGAEEWHPTVTLDSTLYFCSSRTNPPCGYYIYRSRLEDGQYTVVERLDSIINAPQHGAWDPFIAPDESYMIFSSERPDGYGSTDQYISYRKEDSTWSEPQNLGSAINSSSGEYGSYVSYDGNYYFFHRQGDMYWVDTEILPAGINDSIESPTNFKLNQNYPNPFSSSTIISYSIFKTALVELNIYGVLGNKVRTLVNETQAAGDYDIPFDGKNLSAGVYFYKLSVNSVFSEKMKMLLLR